MAEDLKNTINGMNEDEARVVVTDFEAGTHDLKTCEKAIHDYANKHKSGGSACCPGPAVPGILRVHFGLPDLGGTGAENAKLPRMWMMKNQKFICRTHMAEILTPEHRDSHISD